MMSRVSLIGDQRVAFLKSTMIQQGISNNYTLSPLRYHDKKKTQEKAANELLFILSLFF